MDTSQMVSPGLIQVPVCKTGCVDDLNLKRKKKKNPTIPLVNYLLFVYSTRSICQQEGTALSFIHAELFL